MAAIIRRSSIAAIGDEVYIRSVRLMGLSEVLVVDLSLDVSELGKVIKEFLGRLLSEGIRLVIVQDTLKEVVDKVFNSSEALKVVYLPDLRTSDKFNVKDYYLKLLRQYIGVHLEV